MRSSVKLRPSPWDALVLLAILLLAALCAAGFWRSAGRSGSTVALVCIDGAEVDRVELSRLSGTEQRSYPANGYLLQIAFSPDGAEVVSSDCPTQDCVHTGKIHTAGRSIVCLPARLSVQLTGNSPSDGVDMVIG